MHAKTASRDVLTVKLLKSQSLLDVEDKIRLVSKSSATHLDVWLARDLGPQFFKDTRIVCLLAVAATRGMKLKVIDWFADVNSEYEAQTMERFGTTLEGLGSLEYAQNIVDSQKSSILDRIRHLRRAVIEKQGIKTPERTTGQSLTFCAFDPEEPIPIGFAGFKGKPAFTSEFIRYRRDCFEVGQGEGFSDSVPKAVDDQLASFAYELWQNSFQHGRLNSTNGNIRGMRYLRVQKHVGLAKSEIVERAEGFGELRSYLDRETSGPGPFKFYEVTIADNGLGILERFLATRPEYAQTIHTREDAVTFTNRIINEALTSKLSQSGAGHGLEHALDAVRRVRGFVSLRSGNTWLYQAFNKETATLDEHRMHEVACGCELASVGTQFNLIFPL